MMNEEKMIEKARNLTDNLGESKEVKVLVYVAYGVAFILVGTIVIKALTFAVANLRLLESAWKTPVNAPSPSTTAKMT